MTSTHKLKQQTYYWQGINKQGQRVQGEINAANQIVVKAQLHRHGITLKKINRKIKPLWSQYTKKITPNDIANFTRQLATMIKADIPLLQSFDIVLESLNNTSMRKLVSQIKNDIAAGVTFTTALEKHPRYFDALFCGLIKAGEQSGTLDTMLDRLATHKEKTENIKTKIKKALTYPTVVIVVAFIVTTLLLVKVVPQFAQTFADFGTELPSFTLLVLYLSEWTQQWGLAMLIVLITLIVSVLKIRQRSPKAALLTDQWILKAPVIGSIITHSIAAHFARTLATTLAAGTPLNHALLSVAQTTGNQLYTHAIERIYNDIVAGQPLYAAIGSSNNLFPPLLFQMIAIGEKSGTLDSMLEKAASYFEGTVDNKVDKLTMLLEPLIMSVLGVLIGSLMIAMYLPIFRLGSII